MVTEFPANYYTLLTPEEYNELFNDDENDVNLPGSDEEDDELKTDDDPSHSFMLNLVFKSAAAAVCPNDKTYDDILKSSPNDAAAIYCAYRSYTTHNNAPRSYAHRRIYAATYHAHRKYVNYHAPQAYGSYSQSMKHTSAKQISATIAAYHSNWSRGVAAPIDVNRDRSYNFPEVIGYKDQIFSSAKRKEKVKEVTPQPQLWTVQKFQKIQGSEEKG